MQTCADIFKTSSQIFLKVGAVVGKTEKLVDGSWLGAVYVRLTSHHRSNDLVLSQFLDVLEAIDALQSTNGQTVHVCKYRVSDEKNFRESFQ